MGFVLDKIVKAEDIGVAEEELTQFVVRRAAQMGVAPNTLAQHLADNDQLTLAMMEIVREKAKSVMGDAAKVVDTEGNEVDLKAIYAELNPEQSAEGLAQSPAGAAAEVGLTAVHQAPGFHRGPLGICSVRHAQAESRTNRAWGSMRRQRTPG